MMNDNQNTQQPVTRPLLVDLDGSLIRTDTLYETALLFFRARPWMVFMLVVWFLRGKQILKRELAKSVHLNVDSLPYRQDVLDYLMQQHKQGREIILCTGSWFEIAEKICQRFPCFDSCVATDEQRNLTGSNKANWAVEKYGEAQYDYLGNERKDTVVWRHAAKAIVVGDQALAAQAARVSEVEKVFPAERPTLRQWLKAIRIHQWAKNALLFIPLLASHQFSDSSAILNVFIAFVCFGLCASATYLLNDLFDLESDRLHTIKRSRPMAAGVIAIPTAIYAFVVMLLVGGFIATLLNTYFLYALLTYLILTVLYSFRLKKLQTVDVIVLAALFTIRVIAGGAAINVSLSFWLLCFSMFIFLSLAMVKRVAELIRAESQKSVENEKISGRGYFPSDIIILQCLGGTSGFLSVLVFALYINSEEVVRLYHLPEMLWLMCPVLGYWIMRIWMLAARGQMNEDPISFAITDRNSWLAAIVMMAVLSVATFL